MTNENHKPLPVFRVEITCSRQWGTEQQNTLDRLATWSARLSPEIGLRLVDGITTLLDEVLPGALAPISESGAIALEALGKFKQCELPLK